MKSTYKFAGLLALAFALQAGCSHAAPPNTQQAPFTADNHTQLLLHLDGNLDDSGPWGIGSTMRSGKEDWVPGQFGQAMNFDGNTLIQQPVLSQLNVGNNSWTVEAWIKPDKNQPHYSVIWGGGWGFNRIYSLRIDDGQSLEAGFNDGSGNPNINNSVHSGDVSATLLDGNWHEVATVLDRSRHGEIRLYLDGKQLKTQKLAFSGPMLLEGNTMGFCVGNLVPWASGGGYNGGIDELRISNVVRPEYVASYPIPADQIPPEAPAKVPFKFNPADSKKPLALTPESTVIVPVSVVGERNTGDAATLLQGYLRKIYDVKTGFDIAAQDKVTSLDGKAILALGDSKWADDATLAKIPRFGYEIKRKASVVVIAGNDSNGTLAGTAHFLDEFCGVRSYMPGELWISTPVGKKITLGDIQETSSPYVVGTVWTGMEGVSGMADWAAYNNVFRPIGGTDQHNMWAMFPPSLYAEKYPEIYPILNGKRYIPTKPGEQDWQPNFAASQTLEAAEDSVTRYFKANPNYDYVAMGVMDSDAYDQSPETLALIAKYVQKFPNPAIAKRAAYSHQYWAFINSLAAWMQKNEPGKLLMGLAYSEVQNVPEGKMESNVMAITVWGIAELEADGRLKPDASGKSELDQWLGVVSHFGNHDWLQGNGYLIPRSYTGYYNTYFKALKKAGVQSSFQHIEAYPNWGLDGPKYYYLARLMWDPAVNVDVLQKQFSDDMFGPASAPMQKYFATLEKLWIQLDDVDGPERKIGRYSTQFDTTPASMALVREARADLDQAIPLAATPEQKQRIDLFNKCFHMSELFFELGSSAVVPDDQVDARAAELKQYMTDNIAKDPMALYSSMRTPGAINGAVDYLVRYRKEEAKAAAAKK
ncbi:MAG: DUF4838 domain-containing protein [Abditibacteriaceae bacterium]